MLIKFDEHIVLTKSREGGRLAKENFLPILSSASPERKVVFDFDGVKTISSSFADEFFGKVIGDIGFEIFKSKTTFMNLNPFVSNVIKNSVYHRNSDQFQK